VSPIAWQIDSSVAAEVRNNVLVTDGTANPFGVGVVELTGLPHAHELDFMGRTREEMVKHERRTRMERKGTLR